MNSNIVKLKVPYFWQRDNTGGQGDRECCGTSNAMLAAFLCPQFFEGIKRQPEDIYFQKLSNFGDTTDHQANTAALKTFGIESEWRIDLNLIDLIKSLKLGIPVVIGLHYKKWGHIAIAVGFDLDREFVFIHDPFGSRKGATDEWNSTEEESGRYDPYHISTLKVLWSSRNDGWGRIVTSVRG